MTNAAIKIGIAAALAASVPLTIIGDLANSELTYSATQKSAKEAALTLFKNAGCRGNGVISATIADTASAILLKSEFIELRGEVAKGKDGNYVVRVIDYRNANESTPGERVDVKGLCPVVAARPLAAG